MEILVALGIVAEAVILNVLFACGGSSFLLFAIILAVLVCLLPDADRPRKSWATQWFCDFFIVMAIVPPGVAAIILLVDRDWMH